MASKTQSYANHARINPPYHLFVLPVFLVNVLVATWTVWTTPSMSTAFLLVVAVALFMMALLSRTMTLTVQDRVIRLEMRLRLQEVLPADMHSRIKDLTCEQLVGLRFASDAELPGLTQAVLAGQLTTAKEIKQKVTDWQGDFVRA